MFNIVSAYARNSLPHISILLHHAHARAWRNTMLKGGRKIVERHQIKRMQKCAYI